MEPTPVMPPTNTPESSPATRRELRELERAAEARRARGKAVVRRDAVTPGAAPAGASAAAPVPRVRPRAIVGLAFAALLMAATSLSAMGPADSFASIPSAGPAPAPQELLTASVDGTAVLRDAYRATTPEELARARAAAAAAAAAEKAASIGFRTASTYVNDVTSAVQWPFPVGVPISDGFGPRSSPGGIGSTNHKGVDFTPGQGKPISAIAAGVVSKVQRSDGGGLGVYVVIDHVIDGQNVSSWYGHMLTGSPVVSEGQAVLPGQQIGSVGNTGTSTGAHMHLEIHVENTPVDPFAWLSAHN